MEEKTGRVLSSEEVVAMMRKSFFKALSGEGHTEENPQSLSAEFCRVEDIETAKTVVAQEFRAKFIDPLVGEIAKKTQLADDDLHKIRGMLLETMGRLLE